MVQAMSKAVRWSAGAVIGGVLTAVMAALVPGAMGMIHVLPGMNVGFFGGYMILGEDRRTWAKTLLISYVIASVLCGLLLYGATPIGAVIGIYGVIAAGFWGLILRACRRIAAGFVVVRPKEDEEE
ncbi:MAG: hypothetical protein J6K32_02435 [Clostridia bacterium]|nr:hypothetical protein [Clostridia bacterium]